jgi:hypothetical protein
MRRLEPHGMGSAIVAAVALATAASGCQRSYLVRRDELARPGDAVPAVRETDHAPVHLSRRSFSPAREQPADPSLTRVQGRGTHSRIFLAGWLSLSIGAVLFAASFGLLISAAACDTMSCDADAHAQTSAGATMSAVGGAGMIFVGPILMSVGAAQRPREVPGM